VLEEDFAEGFQVRQGAVHHKADQDDSESGRSHAFKASPNECSCRRSPLTELDVETKDDVGHDNFGSVGNWLEVVGLQFADVHRFLEPTVVAPQGAIPPQSEIMFARKPRANTNVGDFERGVLLYHGRDVWFRALALPVLQPLVVGHLLGWLLLSLLTILSLRVPLSLDLLRGVQRTHENAWPGARDVGECVLDRRQAQAVLSFECPEGLPCQDASREGDACGQNLGPKGKLAESSRSHCTMILFHGCSYRLERLS